MNQEQTTQNNLIQEVYAEIDESEERIKDIKLQLKKERLLLQALRGTLRYHEQVNR